MVELSRSHTNICPHTLLIYRSIWGTCQRWKSECLPKHKVKRNRNLSEKRRMHFTGLHGEQADKTDYPSVFQPYFLMFWYKENKICLIHDFFFFFCKNEPEDFLAHINRRYDLMSKWKEGAIHLYLKQTNKQTKIVHMHAFKMKSTYFIHKA